MQLTEFMHKSGLKTAAEKLGTRRMLDMTLGVALCGVSAFGVSIMAQGHSWKNTVPLLFSLVLLVIAGLFGSRTGILSTAIAAVVFASFLFGPTGSMRVADEGARINLGWMMLIGMAFSLLFAPSTSGPRR
ncbi:MAG TPA: DUF4118 domain-containing protein [Candidatus Angelobacter sp.]|nr:DUF4118 domain-containing protein [Candidatus Angelobacter sp.]